MIPPFSLAALIMKKKILNVVYDSGSRAGQPREFFVFSVNQSDFYPEQHCKVYLVGYDLSVRGTRTYKADVLTDRREKSFRVIGFRDLIVETERKLVFSAYSSLKQSDFEGISPYVGEELWDVETGIHDQWPPAFKGEYLLEIPLSERVFVGTYPEGILYADRVVEEHGDYKRIAFLSYSTLKLSLSRECSPDIAQYIQSHAKALQDRKGEHYQVSASGQTVELGR